MQRRADPGEVCCEIDPLAVGDYKLFGGRLVEQQLLVLRHSPRLRNADRQFWIRAS